MLQVLELSPIISQDITSVSGTRMCWTGMPRRLQWLMPRTHSRLIVRWRMMNSDFLICAPMLVNWLFSSRYVIICFGLRLIITPQLLPDVPEPSSYWSHDDPRALAAHKGIIAEMVLDFQPLSLVNNKGFVISKRQVVEHLKGHFYFKCHELYCYS